MPGTDTTDSPPQQSTEEISWGVVADAALAILGFPVVVLDTAGRIVFFNPACETLTGYSLDEVKGRIIWDVLISADDLGAVKAVFQELISGRFPNKFENAWMTKAGERQVIAWDNTTVCGPDGEVSLVVATGVDVTEQRRIEHDLHENEAFYRSVLLTARDGIIAIDAKGIVRSINAAAEKIFGHGAEEVIGQNVSMLMPSPYRQEHDDYLDRYMTTGEKRIIGVDRVVLGQRKDGSIFPLELSIGEVVFEGAKYFTGFVHDITEQQETQARVEELQSELAQVSRIAVAGEMSAVLAHEVNQPLTAAANYLQTARRLLERPDADNGRISEIVAKGVEQTERASDIIRHLREFTRRGETQHKAEDLAMIVEQAAGLALMGSDSHDVTVEWRLDRTVPPVMVDRVQIQQVVLNLLRNSLDVLKDYPERRISVVTALVLDGMAEVAVEDSGPGIAPEIRDRLFAPFTTTKETGTGIGLSMSRSIIEAHGGQIWTESNGDGGATFRFSVPLATSDEVE